jgi:hypothetical protein
MKTATNDAREDHSRHGGQIHQEYYAGLHYYFLSQSGDASEADGRANETISRFFVFMKGRCWEAEAKHFPKYMLDIAGQLCSEKSAAESARRENVFARAKADGLLYKIIDAVIRPVRSRLAAVGSFAGRTAPTAARG